MAAPALPDRAAPRMTEEEMIESLRPLARALIAQARESLERRRSIDALSAPSPRRATGKPSIKGFA